MVYRLSKGSVPLMNSRQLPIGKNQSREHTGTLFTCFSLFNVFSCTSKTYLPRGSVAHRGCTLSNQFLVNKMSHGHSYRSVLHSNRIGTKTPTNKCNLYPSSKLVLSIADGYYYRTPSMPKVQRTIYCVMPGPIRTCTVATPTAKSMGTSWMKE